MEQSRASAAASRRVPARRSRGRGLIVRLAAVVLAVGPAMTLQAVPAAAAECTTESGVTVVVDFEGSVQRGCAPGDPATGAEALRAAGFGVTWVFGQPAVCQLNAYPSGANCQRMPPASAYWSYWRAQPGGSWSYSNDGATGTDPAPGTVEGWAFGAGTPPSTSPPAVPTPPAPEPTPEDPPATADDPTPTPDDPPATNDSDPPPSTDGGGSDESGDGGGDSSSGGSGTSGTDDSVADRTSEGSTAPEESTSSSSSRDTDDKGTSEGTSPSSSTSPDSSSTGSSAVTPVDAETIAAERTSTDSGSSTGLWTGLALVLALAGAGGWVAWRRRDGSV